MTTKRSKFTDIFDRRNEAPAPVPAEPTRKLAKSKDPNYVPLTIYVRKDLRNKVQVMLMENGRGRDVSGVVNELLEAWLVQQKSGNVDV
ncbi:hypothetical protein BH10CHL1_BH10CHL1_06510 [soil metagenome]